MSDCQANRHCGSLCQGFSVASGRGLGYRLPMKKTPLHTLDEAVAKRLEMALDYHFANRSLLALALTHSSWANEGGSQHRHNERLEFLGDAVLELAVSKELFERFTQLREGELTRLRSQLVSTPSLARLARSLDLGSALFMGRGEERQGGRDRDAVLSDAFEAVLAAIYEDYKLNFPDKWADYFILCNYVDCIDEEEHEKPCPSILCIDNRRLIYEEKMVAIDAFNRLKTYL